MAKRTLGAVETQLGCACSDTVAPYEFSIPHFCPLIDASVPRLAGFSLNHLITYSRFTLRVFTRSFGALVCVSFVGLALSWGRPGGAAAENDSDKVERFVIGLIANRCK